MRNLDLIGAIALLVCTTPLTVSSYLNLREIEQPAGVTLTSLPEGISFLGVFSRQKCVASFTREITHSKGFELSLHGTLATVLHERAISSQVDAHATFNPLGQLQEGSLVVTVADLILNLTARGVTPIRFMLDLKDGKTNRLFSLEVAGPLMIRKDFSGYRLEYPMKQQGIPMLPTVNLTYLKNSLDLSIVEAREALPACAPDTVAPLDLNELAGVFGPLAQQVQSKLGGVLP